MTAIPAFADIEDAATRLSGAAVRTPLLESPLLNARCGGRVLIKADCLQRTGSFKFRGAWNRISRLDAAHHKGGVVAYSSGNHAQGVAAAAQLKGLPAVIVMPADTPAIKIANTRGFGAEVVLYDRATESREEIAAGLVAQRGAVLVPPFDDAFIIAGQGTAGLEIAEQAKARGLSLDAMLVCCSGGGLTAGIALALEQLQPEAEIYSVEPEGFDDMARSLASGKREVNAATSGGFCDALLTPTPGELTFPINLPRLAGGFVVTDEEVRAAMRFAFRELKLVAEPGGAVALAAALAGKLPLDGRVTGLIISGGNADPEIFARVLAA
jgi:threonine dehydratase